MSKSPGYYQGPVSPTADSKVAQGITLMCTGPTKDFRIKCLLEND